ncbi:semaphorin-5A-like [Rhinolophus sinicus]|uniref:semaphorin-5A-like n=1 Tax=Rhinolophus sinicus TaxID=89399 RepID=UPI003D79E9DE
MEQNLQDAQKFILMHEVVQPVTAVPAFMEDNSRFTHVAGDVVQARDALVHTIYLATGIEMLHAIPAQPAESDDCP